MTLRACLGLSMIGLDGARLAGASTSTEIRSGLRDPQAEPATVIGPPPLVGNLLDEPLVQQSLQDSFERLAACPNQR